MAILCTYKCIVHKLVMPSAVAYIQQGHSQKSGDGGAKILDRKPHLLINAKTGSNYYSVRVPANNTYFIKQ